VRFAACFWRSSSSAASSVSSGGSTPMWVTPASVSFWDNSSTFVAEASLAAYDNSNAANVCSCLRSTPSSIRTAPIPLCPSTFRMWENDA